MNFGWGHFWGAQMCWGAKLAAGQIGTHFGSEFGWAFFVGGRSVGGKLAGGRSALSLEIKFGGAFWGLDMLGGKSALTLEVNLGRMLGGRLAGG